MLIYIYNTNSINIVSSIYMSKLEDLLTEYDKSKARFDFWLTRAYEDAHTKGTRRVTEGEINLAARNSLRNEGIRDPDTVRWDLKILLASE